MDQSGLSAASRRSAGLGLKEMQITSRLTGGTHVWHRLAQKASRREADNMFRTGRGQRNAITGKERLPATANVPRAQSDSLRGGRPCARLSHAANHCDGAIKAQTPLELPSAGWPLSHPLRGVCECRLLPTHALPLTLAGSRAGKRESFGT